MKDQASNLKKLADIAADVGLRADMRTKATETIGSIGTREAFLVLLELAANEALSTDERDYALKQARVIIKSSR